MIFKMERAFLVALAKAAAFGGFTAIAVTDFIPRVYALLFTVVTDFSWDAVMGILGLPVVFFICIFGALLKIICGAVAALPALAGASYLARKYPEKLAALTARDAVLAGAGLGAANGLLALILGGGGGLSSFLIIMGYFAGGGVLTGWFFVQERISANHYN